MLHKARVRIAGALASNLPAEGRKILVERIDPAIFQVIHQRDRLIEELQRKLEISIRNEKHLNELEKQRSVQISLFKKQISEANAQLEQFQEHVAQTKTQKTKEEKHPIFGKLLHDFGYKKVYATEPAKLVNKDVIPVWEKQRTFRTERAKSIAIAKSTDKRFGYPGVITLYDLDAPGKRGIVDGQHRVGGLEILVNQGHWGSDQAVLTEVYTVPEDHVKDLFKEINQAQPVLDIDMPDAQSNIDFLKKPINIVAERFADEYSDLFRQSQRCRVPHLNVDVFRQQLFNSSKVFDVLDPKLSDEKNAEKLYKWIANKNKIIGTRTDTEWESMAPTKSPGPFLNAVEKCKRYNFYLGIEHSWLS